MIAKENITETRLKLRDAGIQMKLALEHARNEDYFRSCVNSFIAAARSITMSMERESARHPALLAWYKEQTQQFGADPLFRFFNDQRVHVIHRGVVQPASQTFVVENYREVHVTNRATGETKKHMQFSINTKEMPMRPGDVVVGGAPNIAIYWTFPEAAEYLPNGSTNVFRLCEDYFVRLKTLVHAWLARRQQIGIDPMAAA